MNAQYLERARAAYRSGDYSAAAQMFSAVKDPGELCGEVDHLRGNSLMKLGLFADAAAAYGDALADTSYGKQGALLTNRGKALSAAGDIAGAVESFSAATKDASYATPYKAYVGLGNALLAQGNPTDAVEAYMTALDYVAPADDPRAINAGLGQALVAANRPADAIDAFNRATSDGIYQLTAEQQAAYAAASDTLAAQRSMTPVAAGSTAAAAVDPLDPLGKSGAFMPDPSDTGFFTLSESEMIQQDRRDMKVRRKHRHTGLKVFLVILILLLVIAAGLGFAYTKGFGFPSQQDAITGLFDAVTNGQDAYEYLASSLSEQEKELITSSIPEGATPTIGNMEKSMSQTKATVSVELSRGGTQSYEVVFVRSDNHIGWVIQSIGIDFGDATTDKGLVDTDAGDSTLTDGSSDDSDANTDDATSSLDGDSTASDGSDGDTTGGEDLAADDLTASSDEPVL